MLAGGGTPASAAKRSTALDDLIAKEAIRDLTMLSAHAVDRRAWDLLPPLYWPDAILEMEGHRAPAAEFIEQAKLNYERAGIGVTHHFVGNILSVVTGATAEAEIYHLAYHRLPIDGVQRDVLIGGRYHDSFARRKGEWRISGRKVVFDWFRLYPDSGDWKEGIFGIKEGKAIISKPSPEEWAPIHAALRPNAK